MGGRERNGIGGGGGGVGKEGEGSGVEFAALDMNKAIFLILGLRSGERRVAALY